MYSASDRLHWSMIGSFFEDPGDHIGFPQLEPFWRLFRSPPTGLTTSPNPWPHWVTLRLAKDRHRGVLGWVKNMHVTAYPQPGVDGEWDNPAIDKHLKSENVSDSPSCSIYSRMIIFMQQYGEFHKWPTRPSGNLTNTVMEFLKPPWMKPPWIKSRYFWWDISHTKLGGIGRHPLMIVGLSREIPVKQHEIPIKRHEIPIKLHEIAITPNSTPDIPSGNCAYD